MRQEAPKASCAASVAAMPGTASAAPVAWTGVRSRTAIGSRAGKLAQRGGDGAGEAESGQQTRPPLRRTRSVWEAGSRVTRAQDLDEGTQATDEQHPDGDEDKGEDRHRQHLFGLLLGSVIAVNVIDRLSLLRPGGAEVR
jgi:hypothetical protein